MVNWRKNRNTRKAQIYRFTQRSYQQSRKATVSKILDDTFLLNNDSGVTLKIEDTEQVYVTRLEEGNQSDNSLLTNTETKQSDLYGKITKNELETCIKEIKRDTSARPDKMSLKVIHQLRSDAIALILNKWWGYKIHNCVKECRTTLLPKMDKGREKVGNLRPITTGNLFMRLYVKIWDKRLRANIVLDEIQKGFVPDHSYFQTVKIVLQVIKQQRKRKKKYNIVYM